MKLKITTSQDANGVNSLMLIMTPNNDEAYLGVPQVFDCGTCLFADNTEPLQAGHVVFARVIPLPDDLRDQLREDWQRYWECKPNVEVLTHAS